MRFEIKTWWGSVAFSTDAETFRDAVVVAVKSEANLNGAYLRGANLSRADLNGAYLREANLNGAYLRGADLREADLSGANLREADLSGANLNEANLNEANLSGADLSVANLRGANLPSPQIILSAYWGSLSEQLTADLMEYDANSHPDRSAFQRWANGGRCPYDGVKVQRAANFKEDRTLWGKGVIDTPYNLMVRVLKEKTKQ